MDSARVEEDSAYEKEVVTLFTNESNDTSDDGMNVPDEYVPTRAQRRCKHPKWVKLAENIITHTVTERCVQCAMIQQSGGWLGGRFGVHREALSDVDRRSTSMDATD